MSPSEYQDLVAFLGERFAVIDRRFESIDRRFESIDRRFDGVERDLASFRAEVAEFRGEVLGHFDTLYRRLERLEQEYQAITQALRRLEVMMTDEHGRREVLERDLATLKESVAVLKARLDEVERRLQS